MPRSASPRRTSHARSPEIPASGPAPPAHRNECDAAARRAPATRLAWSAAQQRAGRCDEVLTRATRPPGKSAPGPSGGIASRSVIADLLAEIRHVPPSVPSGGDVGGLDDACLEPPPKSDGVDVHRTGCFLSAHQPVGHGGHSSTLSFALRGSHGLHVRLVRVCSLRRVL